ncbi:hypothetical protein K488DRAFT_41109, partial [Vararia minispora EC-137]
AVAPINVNITDELMASGLSAILLRLWFERDERGRRRIPVLLHRLSIRISDSLHPTHGAQSVFRIECEYANGAVRWVIYRQLRDFLSLHTHYAVSNAYNRNVDTLPEFPKTSIPYLKFLQKENGHKVTHADFARLQRQALEDYLIGLVRAVMFHSTSNRLCGFLEISALSIHLAPFGGTQYKAGYVQIRASGSKGTSFGRKSAKRKDKYEQKWCAVRDSYLVAVEDPGELTVFDVFLLDTDFRIERPKRYYRQDSMSSSLSRSNHRPSTPLLDPSTNTNPLEIGVDRPRDDPKAYDKKGKKTSREMSKHTFYIINSQLRLKLFARSERQMLQWIAALERIAASSHYTGSNRFDSFAPIRLNVAAQWLVDGRDYFWNLSRAILLAKDTIYIHDWWLSPELYLRRPNKPKYRLDRLLQRKAEEGVKIYIILYQEVSSRTTPTNSNYSKQRLVNLHPNILVQRSPSHFQTGTFYWAHHEKLCVIDETIAFMGGLDLCFGRWDTPQHALIDDPGIPEETIWIGKDYNNSRVEDFRTLNKPEEDMHDRATTPRMPWHDVGLQLLGQPVRDLARHFVQRWNYLLRIKNHTRIMPFLLPPPEFKPGELSQMGLTGTCELQICRSCGPWSMGTPDRVENSIQNAYLKAIQMSDHFVYIENQFFITSTMVGDVQIENKIGDAIVERILRAHNEGKKWKCCVVIPLLPGFPFPIDHNDASSVRLILECQNRTIGRGPHSIFARLRKEGIDPDNYFSVFSLRNWGKLRGDVLTTELLYIHGKACIVDDRLAIIGSANINERSQRGDRDSELAAIIRDTDMIDRRTLHFTPADGFRSTMAGKPYKVGRFAHTLRVRLMREHVGVDVDALDERDLLNRKPQQEMHQAEPWDPDAEQRQGNEDVTQSTGYTGRAKLLARTASQAAGAVLHGARELGHEEAAKLGADVGIRKTRVPDFRVADDTLAEERETYARTGEREPGFADAMVPTLEEKIVLEDQLPTSETNGSTEMIEENGEVKSREADGGAPPQAQTANSEMYGAPADASRSPEHDDEPPHARSGRNDAEGEERLAPCARSMLRRHLKASAGSPWVLPTPTPVVDPNAFDDPICDNFWKHVWLAAAAHNTEIFRRVFHAVPDDLVTTWKQYIEFIAHHERLNRPMAEGMEPVGRMPSETGDVDAPKDEGDHEHVVHELDEKQKNCQSAEEIPAGDMRAASEERQGGGGGAERGRRGKNDIQPFSKQERDEMEALLGELCGHLGEPNYCAVVYPTRFLEGEDIANNFLFNSDRLLPLPIYD